MGKMIRNKIIFLSSAEVARFFAISSHHRRISIRTMAPPNETFASRMPINARVSVRSFCWPRNLIFSIVRNTFRALTKSAGLRASFRHVPNVFVAKFVLFFSPSTAMSVQIDAIGSSIYRGWVKIIRPSRAYHWGPSSRSPNGRSGGGC